MSVFLLADLRATLRAARRARASQRFLFVDESRPAPPIPFHARYAPIPSPLGHPPCVRPLRGPLFLPPPAAQKTRAALVDRHPPDSPFHAERALPRPRFPRETRSRASPRALLQTFRPRPKFSLATCGSSARRSPRFQASRLIPARASAAPPNPLRQTHPLPRALQHATFL